MWRTLRHFFVKRAGGTSNLRLGQAQVAERNDEFNQTSSSTESERQRSQASYEKGLVRSYDLSGGDPSKQLQDGCDLIRTIIRKAEKRNRQQVAKLKSFVGGERDEDSFSCGSFGDEIKLWFSGVVALSSILYCRNFVFDDNKIDITKLPHVIYCVLSPRPSAALAVLPMVPAGLQPAQAAADSSLNGAIASFESQFSECTAATQNKLGVKFAATKQHHKAFALFQQASDHGHTLAQFNLGLCFENGKGVERDLARAAECYKNAAGLGHGGALYNLALFHLGGIGGVAKNEDKALELLQLAAQTGMCKAQSYLGMYYADNSSNHVDYDKAFAYLEQAAAKGDAAAEYHLGVCYENGLGVERDMSRAGYMYKAAAKHGFISAQYNMGVFYENGLGEFPVDADEALRYYRMAAEAGDEDAQHNYELLQHRQAMQTKPLNGPGVVNHNSILMAFIQGLTLEPNGRINHCASSPDMVDNGKDVSNTNHEVGNALVAF